MMSAKKSLFKALIEFLIKVSYHSCNSINGVKLICVVRLHYPHRDLNVLDLLCHEFILLG